MSRSWRSQDYIPKVFSLAAECVKASNQVPSGQDYNKLTLDASSRDEMLSLCESIEQVISQLSSFVSPNFVPVDTEEAAFEAADKCLENVDVIIDTRDKPTQAPSLLPWADQKPQVSFIKSIDNSHGFFVPKLIEKPNAIVPYLPRVSPDGYAHPYESEIHALEFPQFSIDTPDPPESLELTPLVFVDTPVLFEQFLNEIASVSEIAVDLEHHNHRSYQGFVCLMQLSTRAKDYIVDVFSVWDEMHKLLPIFTDPLLLKVFHGADSDVIWLQRDFGIYIINLFDTHQAARHLRFPRFSLAYLLEHLCGVKSDKSYQRADWRVRPLSEEHIRYARMDTHYLLYLYDLLKIQLGSQDQIQRVFLDSKLVCLKRYEKPDHKYMGLKRGTEFMTPQQKNVLESVLEWRDGLARRLDESPVYIMKTKTTLMIATNPPSSVEELKAKHYPGSKVFAEHYESLIEFIQKSSEMNHSQDMIMTESVNPIPAFNFPMTKYDFNISPRYPSSLESFGHVQTTQCDLSKYQEIQNGFSNFFENLYSMMILEEKPKESPKIIEEGEIKETHTEEFIAISKQFGSKKRKLPNRNKVAVNPNKKQKLSEQTFKNIGWLDNVELAPVKRKNLFKKRKK